VRTDLATARAASTKVATVMPAALPSSAERDFGERCDRHRLTDSFAVERIGHAAR